MKALVVGGNGFIGSHLVDQLLLDGSDVAILDVIERRFDPIPDRAQFIQGELSQSYLLREALTGVDIVFHLAWSTVHETANQDPSADVTTNLIPSIHLFEACLRAGVSRVVFTSSGGTVYGRPLELPIKETHPTNPINAYGITKLCVEKYLNMFGKLYGLDYAILRPSVPYGPRQNPQGLQGAAAVFLYRVSKNLPIKIWGDGSISRDYFFISDLTSALLKAGVASFGENRIINIGGGQGVTLNELLAKVERTVNQPAQVVHEPPREFDADHIVLDTTRAADLLNWKPSVGLDEGLSRTWTWMCSNLPL